MAANSLLTYLSCPYSDPDVVVVESRMSKLMRVDAIFAARGIYTVTPLSKHFLLPYDQQLPSDWNYWQHYSRALLDQCKDMVVVIVDGWDRSVGVQAEIEYAKAISLPYSFVDVLGNPA